MNGKGRILCSAFCDALALVSVAAFSLILIASLLARTGMPFIPAYTCGMLASIVGTLAVSHGGRTLIALPSPAITAWLVYEEIIAHGLLWQELLGVAAVVSLIGAVLFRTKAAVTWTAALPSIVRTGLVFGLGLAMLTTAALYTRILLPSPWALTMGGTLADPLTYYALVGTLLALLLHARGIRSAALPLGMGIIAMLTWCEGFWEVPAAPFLEPELLPTALALIPPQAKEILPIAALGVTLLLALAVESAAVLAACVEEADTSTERMTLARLFTVGGAAALLGAFPLTVAPLSAALPTQTEDRRIAGIPLTAWLSALLLGLLLPCAPLMQALADFPVVPAIALAVSGLLLIARALTALKREHTDFTLREGVVMAVFALAVYDIQTGFTAALLLWTGLTAARGERDRIPCGTWILTAVLLSFALLKQL